MLRLRHTGGTHNELARQREALHLHGRELKRMLAKGCEGTEYGNKNAEQKHHVLFPTHTYTHPQTRTRRRGW